MSQPFIIVGAGTEVVTRVLLPVCARIVAHHDGWPDHAFVLGADGDEHSRSRHTAARLPSDRAPYVPLSMVQVREALAFRKEEFDDIWRDRWESLLAHGPDNGACMIPAVGRLMIRAARPALVAHLRAFQRRLDGQGEKEPAVFIVWSPVSGTSRGSVADLPRYVRAVFPRAIIHGVVLHPIGVDTLDPSVGRVFQANFVEALRLIEEACHLDGFSAWVDDAERQQTFDGRPLDDVFAFDGQYGNLRLRHVDRPARVLHGRLEVLCNRVVDFLAGVLTRDPLYERMRARLADAEMHRSERELAAHRTCVHALHESRVDLDLNGFRQALVERAIERIARDLARAGHVERPDEVDGESEAHP